MGFERTCEECGTSLNADPNVYAALSKARAPVAELVPQKEVGLALIAAIGLLVVGPALTHKAFPPRPRRVACSRS